ncbi:MAG: hypothetical protein M1828_006507 [Chrysothrix sp. TS-e1954]|nr:MAG: hypothetical protein M1828_006507 [Chrysothrix sp. TS-e1954]
MSQPSPTLLRSPEHAASDLRHIWTITGPSGTGKSTVAEQLSQRLGLPYIEGDEYHPQANIDKMASGQPLTDADRWDWLISLREEAVRRLSSPEAGVSKAPSATAATPVAPAPMTSTSEPEVQPPRSPGVILTCSALKRKYRDVIRAAASTHPKISVHFIQLRADEAETLSRVRARKGHYMGEAMVASQFASLEDPDPDEQDCVDIEVSGKSAEQVVGEVLVKVKSASGTTER